MRKIDKPAERLIVAVDGTESKAHELQNRDGHLAEPLKDGVLDNGIDSIYGDLDESRKAK